MHAQRRYKLLSSAFSEEETLSDHVPLTLHRWYANAAPPRPLWPTTTLRALTLILKSLSRYKVNFQCKIVVQLFHPCIGVDFHLSGPWNLLHFIYMFHNFLRLLSGTDSKWRHSQRRDPSVGSFTLNTDVNQILGWCSAMTLISQCTPFTPFSHLQILSGFSVLMSLRKDVLLGFMPFATWYVFKIKMGLIKQELTNISLHRTVQILSNRVKKSRQKKKMKWVHNAALRGWGWSLSFK